MSHISTVRMVLLNSHINNMCYANYAFWNSLALTNIS